MSIFQPQPVQFSSSPAPKFIDSPRNQKNVSRRKERKNRRNDARASKRQLSGEKNKILRTKMTQYIVSNSDDHIIMEVPAQRIPNEEEWHRRMNQISSNN